MKNTNWKQLLTAISIPIGVGIVSWLLTLGTTEQYQRIYKPPLAPPGWLFPIVWTILYILMGIASFYVYRSNSKYKAEALQKYAVQLLANGVWSIIFFRFNMYLTAFAWLVILWYLIFITIKSFGKIDKTAMKLMIPYIVWVTFAGYLNFMIAIHYL